MILDRAFQHKILSLVMDSYPSSTVPSKGNQLLSSDDNSEKKLAANLKYLEEHGLIKPKSFEMSLDDHYMFQGIKITHKGVDFLADDGGLSAILNVVTVKFEASTLKAILESKINQSDLDPDDKKSMIHALEELPAESIKHLTTKLLDECVDNLPAAILLIGTWLGSF